MFCTFISTIDVICGFVQFFIRLCIFILAITKSYTIEYSGFTR